MLGCEEHEKVSTLKCDVTKHRIWVRRGSSTVRGHQRHQEEPQLRKTGPNKNDCGNKNYILIAIAENFRLNCTRLAVLSCP